MRSGHAEWVFFFAKIVAIDADHFPGQRYAEPECEGQAGDQAAE